jgi:hypothetical protein
MDSNHDKVIEFLLAAFQSFSTYCFLLLLVQHQRVIDSPFFIAWHEEVLKAWHTYAARWHTVGERFCGL